MTDDAELLRRYAEDRSEDAFAELVRRHIDFVYSTAVRLGRNPGRADDIVQLVFTGLARKAKSVCRRREIVGWLYISTHYAATSVVRSEARRAEREREAALMQELEGEARGDPDWSELAPVLDSALRALGEADRDAILLRYFRDHSFAEIAEALEVSEEAAKKRVQRALEKLRPLLARSGVTSTGIGIELALGQQTALAAPAGLAGTVTGTAIAQAASGGTAGGVAWVVLDLMATSKTVLAVVTVVAAVGSFLLLRVPSGRQVASQREGELKGSVASAGSRAGAAAGSSRSLTNEPAEPSPPSLSEILAEPDELRAVSLYASLLLRLPPGEFGAVFQRILEVGKPEQKLSFLGLLLQRWGQVDASSFRAAPGHEGGCDRGFPATPHHGTDRRTRLESSVF